MVLQIVVPGKSDLRGIKPSVYIQQYDRIRCKTAYKSYSISHFIELLIKINFQNAVRNLVK